MREQANRTYGVLPYYLTKMLVEMPFQLIVPIIYTVLTYWAIGLRNEAASFFEFLASLLLMCFLGNSIGILLGSVFGDFRAAVGIVPVFLLNNIDCCIATATFCRVHSKRRGDCILVAVASISFSNALYNGNQS